MPTRAKDNMEHILPCRGKPYSGEELCLTRVLIPINILFGMVLSFLFICIFLKVLSSHSLHILWMEEALGLTSSNQKLS